MAAAHMWPGIAAADLWPGQLARPWNWKVQHDEEVARRAAKMQFRIKHADILRSDCEKLGHRLEVPVPHDPRPILALPSRENLAVWRQDHRLSADRARRLEGLVVEHNQLFEKLYKDMDLHDFIVILLPNLKRKAASDWDENSDSGHVSEPDSDSD